MGSPLLYVIVATRAPVAVVFRRAQGWWLVSRWDLTTGDLEHGAWFRGTLYPRRCDLSPDGKLLCCFALQFSRREFMGQTGLHTYTAVSKLPWLFALAAWPELGTWTRGSHFVEAEMPQRGENVAQDECEAVEGWRALPGVRATWELGEPQMGSIGPLRTRHGLGLLRTAPFQYANERRRGWVEHELCPPRGPGDLWDEKRSVVLEKPQPNGSGMLVLTDGGWSAEEARVEGRAPVYRLAKGRRRTELPEARWADWDSKGRLLVATHDGRLQIRNVDAPDLSTVREHDLGALPPAPGPAPKSAQSW